MNYCENLVNKKKIWFFGVAKGERAGYIFVE